ncbi:DUF6090 family protein [Winogradskyella aurantia]|uniref:Uncharacterized protein n=1 Tax=Winogradskyella aurantia TaxID=1915063 RepID=A0A265URV6_9FLAO|nr:DUF6090 family protein [Winogradskyella aurantia]OZV68049.1 hypothetical protein CA834_10405 [Winogradskyella aurantia]
MIKFFRHIRQTIIMENSKSTRYFKYAIGEIILVVIGILIALQINTWNQARLERISEQNILKDLKVEFEANFIDLNRVLNQHQLILKELRALQVISKSKDYTNIHLDSLTNSLIKWFSFTDRPGASNNLISAGNLDIIQNTELRDLITQWTGNVNDVIDDEVFLADFTRETILPFLSKHYPITNLEESNIKLLESLDMKIDREASLVFDKKMVNWQVLLENEQLQSYVALKKMYEYHCVLECRITMRACKKIISLIKSELHD